MVPMRNLGQACHPQGPKKPSGGRPRRGQSSLSGLELLPHPHPRSARLDSRQLDSSRCRPMGGNYPSGNEHKDQVVLRFPIGIPPLPVIRAIQNRRVSPSSEAP
jgi:hypothetical protein